MVNIVLSEKVSCAVSVVFDAEQELGLVRSKTSSLGIEFVVGLESKKELSLSAFFSALTSGVNRVLEERVSDFSLVFPKLSFPELPLLQRSIEGMLLLSRKFDIYLSEDNKSKDQLKKVEVVLKKVNGDHEQALKRALILADSINFMRDLQDTPPCDMYPETFAQVVLSTAKKHKLKCTVLDEKALKKRRYNAICAVGSGSQHPPRLAILEHHHRQAKKTICLVGKGITFDSGGLNIKPTGYMESMKYDMSGAALVLATMDAISQLDLPINVIGIMGLAENMVGGASYRPSDVIKTASGVTVEVGNTDAEGRLVLADALYHATTFEPDAIVDFATLTGACVVALGSAAAGIMGNDEELVETIAAHGAKVNEPMWPLPLFDIYDQDLKSDIADCKSIGYKREAGTISAAAFLKKFVGQIKWAHLDIAGVAFLDRPRFFTKGGGSGWGVRSMVDWLEHVAKNHVDQK